MRGFWPDEKGYRISSGNSAFVGNGGGVGERDAVEGGFEVIYKTNDVS